ncbi:hypothetical protein D3C87_1954440 [compost metagenome]
MESINAMVVSDRNESVTKAISTSTSENPDLSRNVTRLSIHEYFSVELDQDMRSQ